MPAALPDDFMIVRPSGNDTALVFSPVDARDYKRVNDAILAARPSVEQVMFVRKDGGMTQGLMAGGEFCGNATRALGYVLLKGRDGTVTFRVSGQDTPVTVFVRDGYAALTMRASGRIDRRADYTVVDMGGIAHIICDAQSVEAKTFPTEAPAQKAAALALFARAGIADKPAAGLMIVDAATNLLTPYIYVRDIDTFIPETACGSGSIAVAMVQNAEDLTLLQVSGDTLRVTLDREASFLRATLSGPVRILEERAAAAQAA